MMFRASAMAACLAAVACAEDHWAVLVAGSNGYSNYRHQADVCHAYHVLTLRGFHPENIITMMYDDVAGSSSNPFPGKLFNFPWKTLAKAVDVYKGCKIDYRTTDVTPKKFIAVLTGDAQTAGGRVLRSNSADHVFINFVDHGAVGLIGFPSQVMHAKALITTLITMHTRGMYKQLTFYLEACESGSMFQGLLPKSLPVYALTAANARESSWGCYCEDQAKVAGKNIGSCLGDLFSVNWMMDSDKTHKTNETMKEQYARVKSQTTKSHVMRFGQVTQIGSEPVSDFQGPVDDMQTQQHDDEEISQMSAVDSHDIKLDYLHHAYLREGTTEAGDRVIQEVRMRQAAKDLSTLLETSVPQGSMKPISDDITWTDELLDCHEQATAAFETSCGWSEERLPLSRTLYNLCVHTSAGSAEVLTAIHRACGAPGAEIVI